MASCLLAASLGTSGIALGQAAARDEETFPVREDPEESERAENAVDPLQRAREAFLEGRRLMGQELWAEAAEAFEVALAARKTPGLHYYLGVCLEQQGDALGARQAYLDAQALLPKQPAADVAALLPAAIERAESRLSPLELVLVPKHATLRLDGATWTTQRAPWLAPGAHVFYAEAPGYEPLYVQVLATAGVPTRVEVTLKPVPPAPPVVEAAPPPSLPAPRPLPPPPAPPPPAVLPRVVFWSSVAFGTLGGAAGAAGVLWHVDASARVVAAQAELDDAGQDEPSACLGPTAGVSEACQELRAAVAEEESAAMLLVGGFAAAGVGVLGALTSWAIWPDEKFALGGRVGFGSVGVEFSGRF